MNSCLLSYLFRSIRLGAKGGQVLMLVLLAGLLSLPSLGQVIRFVKPTGSGTADGSSWANASGDLQAIINTSASGDQVWVAQGVYKPTSTTDRTLSFVMKNGVVIYGGFMGNETNLTDRPAIDPVAGQPSSTTLSGDINNDGNLSGNSYHVIDNSNNQLTSSAVLDGFVITGGYADGVGSADPNGPGGGMYNVSSDPTVTNCSFINNKSLSEGGGAIYNLNSSPTLTNCFLQNNMASQGGAIFNATSSPTLINCSLQKNTAITDGGGINNSNSSNPMLTNCTFQNNIANQGQGGGISNSNSSNPTLTNCTLQSNTANQGGSIGNSNDSSPHLTDCTLKDNIVYSLGGAIFNGMGSNPTLTNCTLQNNLTMGNAGGAIYNLKSNPSLFTCFFINNSSATVGGAISLESSNISLVNCAFVGNHTPSNGGGIYSYGSSLTLVNNTFQSNAAGSGAAIYTFNGVVLLTNSVVFGNGGNNTFVNLVNNGQPSGITSSYCLLEALALTSAVDVTGPGNLTTTTSPFTSTTSVALNACSPAIDAGDPGTTTATVGTIDLAGNPRFYQNGRIDMGAMEFQATANTPVALTTPLASVSALCTGSNLSLPIHVSGTINAYQWYKDNTSLGAPQQSASLQLSSLQLTDAGSYSVVVTGACNSLTSTAFSLTVTPLPTVSIAPVPSSTIASGASLTLSASGATTYLWSDGSIANPLVLSNVTSTTTLSVTGTTSGCSSTTSISIISNNTGPDLSPLLTLPDANFPSTPGAAKNFIIQIQEVGGLPTAAGNITITLTAPVGYTLALDNTLTRIDVSGGLTNPVTVNNADWQVNNVAGQQLSLTIKPGTFIGAYSQSVVGLTLVRTTANAGSIANITINVSDDASRSYDKNAANNIYARILNSI